MWTNGAPIFDKHKLNGASIACLSKLKIYLKEPLSFNYTALHIPDLEGAAESPFH